MKTKKEIKKAYVVQAQDSSTGQTSIIGVAINFNLIFNIIDYYLEHTDFKEKDIDKPPCSIYVSETSLYDD